MKSLAFALVIAVSLLVVSCSEVTSPTTPLVVPDNYDSSTFIANSTEGHEVRANLTALLAKLKTARTQGVTLDTNELASLYAPLRAITAPGFQNVVDQHLINASLASGNSFDATKPPAENGNGGVYGAYYFDKYGRDIEEHIQKGLFATMLYNRALALVADGVTAADIDNMIALYGANPSFKNTDKATEFADVFCAGYAARRDKNDGNGFYSKIKKAFITAQAAGKAGSNYKSELDVAVADVKLNWEKSQMATTINYLYSVITKLSATSIDDAARASAIHAFGEAAGILVGWSYLGDSQRKITTTQLNELLGLLNMSIGTEPACHLVWQDSFTTLPKLEQAIIKLQSIYGFTDQEMVDFKSNWVSVQSRN